MSGDRSIEFFDRQFERQVEQADVGLDPFEQDSLTYLHGKVLDCGCGIGQLTLAAARAGCSVLALDASEVAIDHLRRVADLRSHRLTDDFDTIVSIGRMMFFDCATADAALAELEAHLRPGGTMIVNVLVDGTTCMDMFDPPEHCLFERGALSGRFAK